MLGTDTTQITWHLTAVSDVRKTDLNPCSSYGWAYRSGPLWGKGPRGAQQTDSTKTHGSTEKSVMGDLS